MSASSWMYAHRYSVFLPGAPARRSPDEFGYFSPAYGEIDRNLQTANLFVSGASQILMACRSCRVLEPAPDMDRAGQPTGTYVVLVNGPRQEIAPRIQALMDLAMQVSDKTGVVVRENPITEIAVSGVWWTFLPVAFGT